MQRPIRHGPRRALVYPSTCLPIYADRMPSSPAPCPQQVVPTTANACESAAGQGAHTCNTHSYTNDGTEPEVFEAFGDADGHKASSTALAMNSNANHVSGVSERLSPHVSPATVRA